MFVEMDESIKRELDSHVNRIESNEQQLDTVRETLAALKEIEKQNQKRIDALENKVDTLSDKPAKYWDYVITAGIAAFVSYIISNIGGLL